MTLRVARSLEQIANATGAVRELPLPQIEGLLILPRVITFGVDLMTGANRLACGLSYNRDVTAPAISADIMAEQSVWLFNVFSLNGNHTLHLDVRNLELELAGPQAFVMFNGEASARTLAVIMWYDTKQVAEIEWAAVANRTSYED